MEPPNRSFSKKRNMNLISCNKICSLWIFIFNESNGNGQYSQDNKQLSVLYAFPIELYWHKTVIYVCKVTSSTFWTKRYLLLLIYINLIFFLFLPKIVSLSRCAVQAMLHAYDSYFFFFFFFPFLIVLSIRDRIVVATLVLLFVAYIFQNQNQNSAPAHINSIAHC